MSDRPPMPDVLRPLAEDAFNRLQRRRAAPDVVSLPDQGYFRDLTSPYRDEDAGLWLALLLDCFGTRVQAVGQAFFDQLAALCPDVLYEGETEARRDETLLRQALAIVCGIKPRNELEACLAAQSVALHLTAMKLGSRIARSDYVEPRNASALSRLSKAFAGNVETLQRLRGRKSVRQTIVVKNEKHIHNHKHVHIDGPGPSQIGDQPHEFMECRAAENDAGAAVSGEVQGGRVVPFCGDEGQAGLPIPWRGKSGSATR